MPLDRVIIERGDVLTFTGEAMVGGQGEVRRVANDHTNVVKIYKPGLRTADQISKLRAMIAVGTHNLQAVTAWPTAIVLEPRRRMPIGFVMPFFGGSVTIGEIYNPICVPPNFSRPTWKTLCTIARSMYFIAESVHRAGCVIGDVNQKNFMLRPDGRIRLIDCDSFQIQHNGRIFRAQGHVPEYCPPEVQCGAHTGPITPNQDAFGLAVLCYQLLRVSDNPGLGLTELNGPAELWKKITTGRGKEIVPRIFSDHVPARALGEAKVLFERAFTEAKRPSTQEWIACLSSIIQRTVECKRRKQHLYWQPYGRCPWCEKAAKTGKDIFSIKVRPRLRRRPVPRRSVNRPRRPFLQPIPFQRAVAQPLNRAGQPAPIRQRRVAVLPAPRPSPGTKFLRRVVLCCMFLLFASLGCYKATKFAFAKAKEAWNQVTNGPDENAVWTFGDDENRSIEVERVSMKGSRYLHRLSTYELVGDGTFTLEVAEGTSSERFPLGLIGEREWIGQQYTLSSIEISVARGRWVRLGGNDEFDCYEFTAVNGARWKELVPFLDSAQLQTRLGAHRVETWAALERALTEGRWVQGRDEGRTRDRYLFRAALMHFDPTGSFIEHQKLYSSNLPASELRRVDVQRKQLGALVQEDDGWKEVVTGNWTLGLIDGVPLLLRSYDDGSVCESALMDWRTNEWREALATDRKAFCRTSYAVNN
ncbi:MAG: hypothetical protein KF841_13905 [Phycisphaerae bacterium]|nr:hypothetical protein [Phycisphaerae bacterium]